MLLTLLISVLTHNLALGLLAGVALAGLLFSRKVAKVIEVSSELIAPGHRLYRVRGQSGVTALDQVIRRLKLGGSRVEVLNLNPESTDLFARSGVAEEAGGRGGTMAGAH